MEYTVVLGKARATFLKRGSILLNADTPTKAMLDSTLRYLQSADDGQRKINQFIAFALWNLLLLFCCVLPILRAYARRIWTNRQVRLPARQQQPESSMNSGAGEMSDNVGQKKQKIEAAIMGTTMVRVVITETY
jgi:hypothetical protein